MHPASPSSLVELYSVLSNTMMTASDFFLLVCDKYPPMEVVEHVEADIGSH